jgi:peroxiredoxin
MWTIIGVLFAAASLAIHYQVKVRMHQSQGGSSVRQMGNLKVGQEAPDFSLQDLTNRMVILSSLRREHVVLLDFWATWCGPCKMAMPGLQALQDEFKERGLEILSINQGEPPEPVRNFISRKKYTFHVVLDPDGAVGSKYGVRGIPTLVVVDKRGLVQWLHVGYSDDISDLHQLLQRLTQEK